MGRTLDHIVIPPVDPVPKGKGPDSIATSNVTLIAPSAVGPAGVTRESATGHPADRIRIKPGKAKFRAGPGAALSVTAVTSAPAVLNINN